jgi:hypothetical protein
LSAGSSTTYFTIKLKDNTLKVLSFVFSQPLVNRLEKD